MDIADKEEAYACNEICIIVENGSRDITDRCVLSGECQAFDCQKKHYGNVRIIEDGYQALSAMMKPGPLVRMIQKKKESQ